MSTTSDPDDPRLRQVGPDGMQNAYLVLSDAEREQGFVRPVRNSYQHLLCSAVTRMGSAIAETYARRPAFYGATYCVGCKEHFPVGADGEFVWVEAGEPTDLKVGT